MKAKPKNLTTYRATFDGLHIRQFGIEKPLAGPFHLEVYQARVSPELWLVRPEDVHFPRTWKARSAKELMQGVETWFDSQPEPWVEETHAARPRSHLARVLRPPAPGRQPKPTDAPGSAAGELWTGPTKGPVQ